MAKKIQNTKSGNLGFLESMTGDKSWVETKGLQSGSGSDYWFRNDDNQEANINIDQFYMTMSIDGETIYEGEVK